MRTSSLKVITFFAILFSQSLGALAGDISQEPETRWFVEGTTDSNSNSDSNIDVDSNTNTLTSRDPSPQDLSKVIGILFPTHTEDDEARDIHMAHASTQLQDAGRVVAALLSLGSSSGGIDEPRPEKREPQLGGLTSILSILGIGGAGGGETNPEKREPQLAGLTGILGILGLGGAGGEPNPEKREPQVDIASLLQSLGLGGGSEDSSGDHPPPEKRDFDIIMESVRREPQLLSILGPLLGAPPSDDDGRRRDVNARRGPQLDLAIGLSGLLGNLPEPEHPTVEKEP